MTLCIIGIVAGLAAVAWAEVPSAADPAWEAMSRQLTEEARRRFVARQADPDRDLGLAASLLTAAPTSEGRLDEAEALLGGLVGGPREAEALWLLARIPHLHRAVSDRAEAQARYRRLCERRPDHVLAQAARVKLAILALAGVGFDPEIGSSQVEAFEIGVTALAPGPRRDLRLILAEAWQRLGEDARASKHLEALIDEDGLAGPVRGDVLVRAATLARRAGDIDRADRHDRAFLAEFPRDQRADLINRRLQERR